MIPVIYRKSNYLETLQYVLGKDDAKLIDTNLGGRQIDEFNKQFLANQTIKPNLTNPCVHLILSIANKDDCRETLTDKQWSNVARKYLQELEYLPNDNNGVPSQYVAVRHHDREHEHLHIIASQIRLDGSKVNDSFDYFKAQTATRLIAHEMGLEVTPTSCKAVSDKLKNDYGIEAPTSDNRSKSIRQVNRKGNEPSTKDIIKDALTETVDKSENISEFFDTLETKQVGAIARLDKNQQILGFAYTHKGITIAGNQISKKLSWGKLKDTLKFDMTNDDLHYLLLAKTKALADISKHQSKTKDEVNTYQDASNKTDDDNSSDERPVNNESTQNNTNSYDSIIPSISEIFAIRMGKEKPDKSSKQKTPTNDSNDTVETDAATYTSIIPSIKDIFRPSVEDNNQSSDEQKDNNNTEDEATTYTSIIPSIEDIFRPRTIDNKANPTLDDGQSDNDDIETEATPYTSIIPSIEDIFRLPTIDNNQSSKENVNSTKSDESQREIAKQQSDNNDQTSITESKIINQNIREDDIQQALRTITAYMAYTDKTEIDGDTLIARLDGNNLMIQSVDNGKVLLEANYSTRTNQWTVEQSNITEEHLKRIAQLQRSLPQVKTHTKIQRQDIDINE
jgi:hypothetical protein